MPWQSICKEISSGVTRRICESERIWYASIFEIETSQLICLLPTFRCVQPTLRPMILSHLLNPYNKPSFASGIMNGRNLQPLPIWKWSSEPNLHEDMFHLNLHGCTTVPGESNEFGSIFPSKCPRWASWESTVDLFPPHRNRSGETYTPQKLTWIPKMMVWKRWLLWKNGHVLVSMLHFRGVPPRFWGWCVGLVEYQSVLWFSQKLLWHPDIITCPPS